MTLNIDENRLAGVLSPSHAREDAPSDEAALVSKALETPIGSPRLREMAKGKSRVLVITSDHTRPLPSAITLPPLLDEIRAGNPQAEIKILIATGTHRSTTDAEMRQKFGEALVRRETFINHVCTDDGAMVFKGVLPSGGELWLNGLVDWADLLVAEGFIEPHFFAGFSGGAKSVLPGIAARKTVLHNHNAGFLSSPLAACGNMDGNPLRRDMRFAAEQAKLAFILNVVLDADKRVAAAFAGEPGAAHEKGCEACLRRTAVARIGAEIAVTSNGGYPLDQNVYQSVKGMTAGEACVPPGGVVILCAALGDGVGGDPFYRWFAEASGPAEVAERIKAVPADRTREDQWQAQILSRVLLHATVIFVTGPENRAVVEALFMTWAECLDDAMRIAEGIAGAGAKVVVIPDGVGVVIQ